jgi:hypothetical protein
MLSHPSHQEFPMTEAKPMSAPSSPHDRRHDASQPVAGHTAMVSARGDEVQPSFRLPDAPARA